MQAGPPHRRFLRLVVIALPFGTMNSIPGHRFRLRCPVDPIDSVYSARMVHRPSRLDFSDRDGFELQGAQHMATATVHARTVGVFATREAAERAIADLKRQGYRDDQIGLVGKD